MKILSEGLSRPRWGTPECLTGSPTCHSCQAWDHSIFNQVAGEALAELDSNRQTRRFAAGTYLYLEGETARCVYCVRRGRVKLQRSLEDGRDAILGIAVAGDLLGVRPLLLGKAHESGAQALEDTTVCVLERNALASLLRQHSGLSLQLAMRLSNHLQEARQQLVDTALKTPADRVRELLVSLAGSHGAPTPEGVRISLGLSQDELAALAGMSRRTLNRALKQLRQKGFLECSRRTILVHSDNGVSACSRASENTTSDVRQMASTSLPFAAK